MPRDYYEVLDVERGADEATIKKAFRKLARELHPDVNSTDPDAEERFKEAAEAYEVLSDAERRRTYDAFGHDGLRSGGYRPASAGFGSIQDIFDSLFGRSDPLFDELFGRGGGPAGGGDVVLAVEIGLADVLDGVQREVEFEAIIGCEHCNGNGAEPGTPIVTCETCDGAGQVRQVSQTPFGQMVRAAACPSCGGAGKTAQAPCAECDGKGRRLSEKSYEVDIPAGIEHGQRLRIGGAGHAGEPGGRTGDLYVQISINAHDDFHREGRDLVSVVEIPVTVAMLGATIPVPRLDGDEQDIEIEAGTQHGDSLRIKGQGLPSLRSSSRGDLHIVVKLITPVKLDPDQRDLVERLDSTLEERNEPGSAGKGIFERMRRAFR